MSSRQVSNWLPPLASIRAPIAQGPSAIRILRLRLEMVITKAVRLLSSLADLNRQSDCEIDLIGAFRACRLRTPVNTPHLFYRKSFYVHHSPFPGIGFQDEGAFEGEPGVFGASTFIEWPQHPVQLLLEGFALNAPDGLSRR